MNLVVTDKMNILTTRQDIAQALNFGKYKVLTYDMDLSKGSKAVVEKQTRNHGILKTECTVYMDKITEGDGVLYLLTRATMMKGHYGVEDYLECAERANAPIIQEGDEVAVLFHSKENSVVYVRLVKAGKVTPEYSTSVTFTDLEK